MNADDKLKSIEAFRIKYGLDEADSMDDTILDCIEDLYLSITCCENNEDKDATMASVAYKLCQLHQECDVVLKEEEK